MRKTEHTVRASRNLLRNCNRNPDFRLKSTAFTRRRRLGAERLLHLLRRRIAAPLQLELDMYFAFYKEKPVSKQAFSKARANLNPEYVRKFADALAEIHTQGDNAPKYRGMRLITIDGTESHWKTAKN